MTRDEMIDAMVANVDNWDLPNLIEWIKHRIREDYNKSEVTLSEIEYDYEWYVGEE